MEATKEVQIRNRKFLVSSQPEDYWKWIAEGRYDNEFTVYDAHLIREHTFVDLGAWVGAHSLYASATAKRVVSVEPDPVAFDILAVNLPKDVILMRKAISDKSGVVTLGSGLLGASTTRVNPSAGSGIGPWVEGQTFEVECLSLRELVKDLPDPLFIKIDVEGSEESVFKDLELFAERRPTVLVELHPFWWKDINQTWQDFEALKRVYKHVYEVHHKNSNTWVLHD